MCGGGRTWAKSRESRLQMANNKEKILSSQQSAPPPKGDLVEFLHALAGVRVKMALSPWHDGCATIYFHLQYASRHVNAKDTKGRVNDIWSLAGIILQQPSRILHDRNVPYYPLQNETFYLQMLNG